MTVHKLRASSETASLIGPHLIGATPDRRGRQSGVEPGPRHRRLPVRGRGANASGMGILGKIFTWWDGATITTLLNSAMTGEKVGTDAQGNTYHRAKKRRAAGQPFGGSERRWVIYNGANDASRVPPEWHGWLHGSFDGVPESNLPPARIWEVDYTPNATGTVQAYRPQGALERGGKRARATGDYEAWSPDGVTSPDA